MTLLMGFTLFIVVVDLLVEMKCRDFSMMPFDVAEVEVIGLRLIISRYSKSSCVFESNAKIHSPVGFEQRLCMIWQVENELDLSAL